MAGENGILQWVKERWTFARGVGLIALGIGLLGIIPSEIHFWFSGLCLRLCPNIVKVHTNISAELLSIGIAVLVIDAANERRAEQHRTLYKLRCQGVGATRQSHTAPGE